MELKIYNPNEEEGFIKAIEWNYEELKAELSQKLEQYKGLVYTEDQIKEAKADRAKLNALTTAIDDKRKQIKKQCLQPYEQFEAQIKDLLEEVKALFDKLKDAAGEGLEFVGFEQIFEDKFLNASLSLKMVETVISNKFNSIKCNLKTIADLKEYSFEATEVYKETLNLNEALEKARYMVEIAKKKAEADSKEGAEVSEDTAATAKEGTEEKRAWVRFEAYLTSTEARALGAWFKLKNIKIRRI